MKIQLFAKIDKTVNLIFTDYAIRMVEMKQTSPIVVQKAEERQLPAGLIKNGELIDAEGLLRILQNCVDDWGIKRRSVRFVVPDNYIAMRNEKVSKDLEEDEIKGHFFIQIGTTIHLPFEEPVFDAVITGESEGKQDVLLIAAPEEQVRQFKELIEDAKLRPVAADIGPLSLYRLFFHQEVTNAYDHELLIDLKQNLLTISIFHQHQPKFIKPVVLEQQQEEVSIGSEDMADKEVNYLLDAMKELENVINFYENSLHRGQVQIARAFVVGDHSHVSYVHTFIRQNLGLETFNDEQAEVMDKAGEPVAESFFTAVGLGLKEV
ncbi:type IV pilus assembly protein PilM [Bacillus ectoiniformans]|uniref:type IV pilus biogenesis protein PilM n=1 Tax=Bacillus ectoiniformans TaxID=1494429 RepID=UPI00195A8D0C|nr:pilus assembly protein PilM [Bacillus ectoiniformans]MBM7648941.1 type IV pilus assembly protein PilM [Bacillus ectoiniformans]